MSFEDNEDQNDEDDFAKIEATLNRPVPVQPRPQLSQSQFQFQSQSHSQSRKNINAMYGKNAPLLPCEREEDQFEEDQFGDENVEWGSHKQSAPSASENIDFFGDEDEDEDEDEDDDEVEDDVEPHQYYDEDASPSTSSLVDRVFANHHQKQNQNQNFKPKAKAKANQQHNKPQNMQSSRRKQTLAQKEAEINRLLAKVQDEEKTITRLRHSQQTALKEVMEKKQKVISFCNNEKETTAAWVEAQQQMIKREKQKVSERATTQHSATQRNY